MAIGILRLIFPIIVIIFAIVVLILIPQKNSTNQQKQKYIHLTTGVWITTVQGDTGIVEIIEDNLIVLQHIDGRKIEIMKHAITQVHHERP